jgi:hypothetical protein
VGEVTLLPTDQSNVRPASDNTEAEPGSWAACRQDPVRALLGVTLVLLLASFFVALFADAIWGLFDLHMTSQTADIVVVQTPLRGPRISYLIVLLCFLAMLSLRAVFWLHRRAHGEKRWLYALAAVAVLVGLCAGEILLVRVAEIDERLVINTRDKVVVRETEYLFRRTDARVSFDQITQVEYHHFAGGDDSDVGEVRLYLSSGWTLTISHGQTTKNYALATTLQRLIDKPLQCWAHDSDRPHVDDCPE